MLRKKGDTYEVDRELTGKLAIESNAKLQEENEKLKEDNRDLRLTNIAMRRVLLKLDKENKKLKEERERKIREESITENWDSKEMQHIQESLNGSFPTF